MMSKCDSLVNITGKLLYDNYTRPLVLKNNELLYQAGGYGSDVATIYKLTVMKYINIYAQSGIQMQTIQHLQ